MLVIFLSLVFLSQLPSDDALRKALLSRMSQKMGPAVSDGFLDVAGVRTHYFEANLAADAVPVVLVHGAGEGAVSWYPVFSRLAADRHVIAPDVVGYGESDKPDAPYDAEYYSGWLLSFLDARGLGRVDVVGSSQGGAIALHFAARHPDRVRRVVVASPAGFAPIPPAILAHFALLNSFPNSWLQRWSLSYLVANSSAVMSEWVDYGVQVSRMPGGKNVFWNGRGRIIEAIPSDVLARERAPVLILWGKNDSFLPYGAGKKAADLLPNSRLVILSDAGHLPYFDQPDAFAGAVLDFLDSQDVEIAEPKPN
ncbi:alpha/beta fold hydrolase [Candidatus Micrarchaeota archaeon]|nr:alpha/beta fold hydrolase [Candidatus Micrarchaeota archaeon]